MENHDVLKDLAEHRLTGVTMTTTDSGREMLTLLVACAFDSRTTIVANGIEFFGETGLAPEWRFGPLSDNGKEWVSACVMVHLSPEGLAFPISMKGPNPVLRGSRDETENWTQEEGAYYGNIFTSSSQDIEWAACVGRDHVDGTCAIQDITHKDVTICGMAFDGKCARICDRVGKYYTNCRGSFGNHRHIITVFDL